VVHPGGGARVAIGWAVARSKICTRHVAVNYSIGSPHNYPEPIQTRLAVIDVATGATKLDTLLFEGAWQMAVGEGYTMFGTRPDYLQGMAWWTVDSLRLAIRHDGVLSLRVVTVP